PPKWISSKRARPVPRMMVDLQRLLRHLFHDEIDRFQEHLRGRVVDAGHPRRQADRGDVQIDPELHRPAEDLGCTPQRLYAHARVHPEQLTTASFQRPERIRPWRKKRSISRVASGTRASAYEADALPPAHACPPRSRSQCSTAAFAVR